MKLHFLLCFYLLIPLLIFAPEIAREKNAATEKTTSREKRPEQARPIETKVTIAKREIAKTTTQDQSMRHPHEINEKTGHSDFEFALKDAFKKRQKNPSMTREESLDHARELYEKAKRDQIKTKDFVIHLKDRYNSGRLSDYYGEGKHDEHSKELMKDLETIDPYLSQKFRDSFVETKQKTTVKSFVTEKNFTEWLEQNPEYITKPAKYTGKFHEKTPLEDAIELKDPTVIEAIIRIAEENGITEKQLVEPIKEKVLDLLGTGGKDKVTEYLKTISEIGSPKLSEMIIKTILTSELEWAVEKGDTQVGQEALKIALENEINIDSLAEPLIEKYKKMAKDPKKINDLNNYVENIYNLKVPELTKKFNEEITISRLRRSIAKNDIQAAKKVIEDAKKLKVSSSFIADELAEQYNYLHSNKGEDEANSFLNTVNELGNDTLYTKLYYKLFPDTE
jgi:hypothetical protein